MTEAGTADGERLVAAAAAWHTPARAKPTSSLRASAPAKGQRIWTAVNYSAGDSGQCGTVMCPPPDPLRALLNIWLVNAAVALLVAMELEMASVVEADTLVQPPVCSACAWPTVTSALNVVLALVSAVLTLTRDTKPVAELLSRFMLPPAVQRWSTVTICLVVTPLRLDLLTAWVTGGMP